MMSYRDRVTLEIAKRCKRSDLDSSELIALTDFFLSEIESGPAIIGARETIAAYAGRIRTLEAEKRTRDESEASAIQQLEYEAGIREQELADLRALIGDTLDLVEDSRRAFHDSTVWEDEEYVGDISDIAERWKAIRGRAAAVKAPRGGK